MYILCLSSNVHRNLNLEHHILDKFILNVLSLENKDKLIKAKSTSSGLHAYSTLTFLIFYFVIFTVLNTGALDR